MNKYIIKALAFLQSSLDTHTKGASARKLTAFWLMAFSTLAQGIVIAYCLWRRDLKTLIDFVEDMRIANYLLLSACLGLTTMEYINKKKEKPDETPVE